MHICMYRYIDVRLYGFTVVQMYGCMVYKWTYVFVLCVSCVCVWVYVYVWVCVCVYVCMCDFVISCIDR